MRTMWSEADRRELVERLGRLRPDARPQWGKMSVTKMLEHLSRALQMATGELAVASRSGPLRLWPVRKLIIYVAPFPKGAPTAPELIPKDEGDFASRRAALKRALDRFVAHPRSNLKDHPAFGSLTAKDWGCLAWRHFDHHLRQFDV